MVATPRVRVSRNSIVRFSGSISAFSIWRKCHTINARDDIEYAPSFWARGHVSRVLLPRIEGADTRVGSRATTPGCHTSRKGEGY
jgi:hypothetical protein